MPSLQRVGAGARDDVDDLVDAGAVEAELAERLVDLVDGLVADPAEHEVLLDRRAAEAARVVAHDLGDAAQLLGRQVAADDAHLHRREAVLALRLDARLAPLLEGGGVAVRLRVVVAELGGVRLLVGQEQQRDRVEVALVDPVALELLLDHVAELVDPDLVDQDLDAGAGAVDAQEVLAVEDPEDGLGDLEEVAVLELDELVERRRDARHDRRAAADAHLDALDAVLDAREEGDVVDAGDRPVLVRRGEGGLDLARHQLRRRVADEVADVGAGPRRDVEQLALADAGERVAGDVADGVAAALTATRGRSPRCAGSARPRPAAGRGASGCSAAS